MPKIEWRIMTAEEEAEYEARPETIAQREYERRSRGNARPHCACGRFAKPGRAPELNVLGEYDFSIICKVHGEVWIS